MKKLFFILTILFTVLSLLGALYVLLNHGSVGAGYAVVPMILTVACSQAYRSYKV